MSVCAALYVTPTLDNDVSGGDGLFAIFSLEIMRLATSTYISLKKPEVEIMIANRYARRNNNSI